MGRSNSSSKLVVLLGLSLGFVPAMEATAQDFTYTPEFNADKELMLPQDEIWREWVYIGTPLTPNSLNDGAAPFPEFHSVYMEPGAYAYYKETGTFAEGTVLAKELTLVGATEATSGIGFFMGDFSGFEITIKSKALYPDEPGNWAYYTFGHQPMPYNETAQRMPTEACNACHDAAAAEDFVFTQYYPFLRAAKP